QRLADVSFGPKADISDKPKIDGLHEHVENTTPNYNRGSSYHESGIQVRSCRDFYSQPKGLSLIHTFRGKANFLGTQLYFLQRIYSLRVFSQSNSYTGIHRLRFA